MNPSTVVGRLLRGIADALAPLGASQRPPVVVRAPGGATQAAVQECSLSLLDPGVESFVLLRVVREEDDIPSVKMSGSVSDLWWPILAQTMSDIAREVRDVRLVP